MPATLAVGSDYFVKPLYPLFGDELGYEDFPEGFAVLTEDELPPEFTTYNAPFMIDEEDIDLPNFPGKKHLGPNPDTEIDPSLLPPPLTDEDEEEDGVKASDFDFDFDEGVGKEFGGDFADEEDDEYGIDHAMDEEIIPDAIPDDETAIDDGVVPPADDEEVIPEGGDEE